MSVWGEPERLDVLYAAIAGGDVDVLAQAIKEGYDAHTELRFERSIISCAAGHSVHTLRKVVELLHCVDIREQLGKSPLFSAVSSNDMERCAALLNLGASTEWREEVGRMNVYHWLCIHDHRRELLELLLSRATLSALLAHDDVDHTPLTFAIEESKSEYVAMLVRRFMELDGPVDLRIGPDRLTLPEYLARGGYVHLADVLSSD